MKFIHCISPREYITADRMPVCLLKFLLVVNNGCFEYIQFIAPQENWSYLEINSKQVILI